MAAIAVALGGGLTWWLWPQRSASAGVTLRSAAPRAGALPLSYPAPVISCPDQDGVALDNNAMRGKVWIADFIFTHCANTCPRMTTKRAELQKVLDDPRIMFLSISVDPDRDDRTTRKSYGADHGMNQSRWKFVCPPDRDAALRIAEGMKIGVPGHDLQSPILHSDRFILIDPLCRVRNTYPLEDPDAMSRLISDARALANALPSAK